MAIHEHTMNDALAEVLSNTRSLWRGKGVVASENLGAIKGTSERPDVVVAEQYVSPVVIEAEVAPATAEADAIARLGQELSASGRRILSSLAVRYPARLRRSSNIRADISAATDIDMAVYTGENPQEYVRWPTSGWLRGNVTDLSILVQGASIPPAVVETAADKLTNGVREAAALLEEIGVAHPGTTQVICHMLKQPDAEQTRRMAMAILANALVFHETLARGPADLSDVQTLDELRSSGGGLAKSGLLAEWGKILEVNYWPIFDIARRILEVIPADKAKALLGRLDETAIDMIEDRLMRSHDLTGSVFQRVIVDRKFLAAFYTHPASAALLVGLAISPLTTPAGGEWSPPEEMTTLRIADMACGTGTLLSAAYRRISQLHEAAGGDAEAIHPAMMARSLSP